MAKGGQKRRRKNRFGGKNERLKAKMEKLKKEMDAEKKITEKTVAENVRLKRCLVH